MAQMERPGGPVGPAGRLTSFRGGIQTFTDALATALGAAVESGHALERLERIDGREGSTRLWRLDFAGGELLEADEVVLAVPAAQAAPLVAPLDEVLAATLRAIPSAGLAVVALAYDAATFQARALGRGAAGAPDGFGFLVPRGEGPRILGALWDSSVFPGERAPAGKVLLRVMIGGALDPEAVGLPEEELLAIARADLATTMGLAAATAPERHWIFRHRVGISQYTVGHAARLAAIATRLATLPGPAHRRSVVLRRQHERLLRTGGALRRGAHRQLRRPGARRGLRVLIAGCGDLGTALGLELAGRSGRDEAGPLGEPGAAGGSGSPTEPCEVYGLRRNPASLPAPLRPLAADLGAPETLRELPEVDTVVYAAAADRSTEEAYRIALTSTAVRNLLTAPALQRSPPRRFFFVSSTAVYAQDGGEWIDESSPAEATHFRARLLLEGERLLRDSASAATAVTVLRLSGIYGPGRTRLVELVRSGRATYPPGPPRYANRIHRDDAAGALAHLLQMTAPEALYLGVDDAPVDLAEVFDLPRRRARRTAAAPRGSSKRRRPRAHQQTLLERPPQSRRLPLPLPDLPRRLRRAAGFSPTVGVSPPGQ